MTKSSLHDYYQATANTALRFLARDCLGQHHYERNLLAARINLHPMACGNLISSHAPGFKSTHGGGAPSGGFFAGKNIFEILQLCFEKDAIELLLASAGNEYQFWNNLSDLWHPAEGDDQMELPASKDELQRRLDRIVPFGFSSTASDWKRNQLMPLLVEGFDPEKLDAWYAAELLNEGILLLTHPSNYKSPSRLVLSPLFRKLVPGYQLPAECVDA